MEKSYSFFLVFRELEEFIEEHKFEGHFRESLFSRKEFRQFFSKYIEAIEAYMELTSQVVWNYENGR